MAVKRLARSKLQNSCVSIDLKSVKAVIFDVDGTFYDLKRMYARVRLEVFRYYLFHPKDLQEIQLVTTFIRERESRVDQVVDDLESAQYEWAAIAAGVPPEKVRTAVKKWVDQVPLKYIYSYRHPEILQLFQCITNRGIATGVFSDYPPQAKLAQLGLSPDCVVSAIDRNVRRLKPDPTGLLVAAEKLNVNVEQCLFIGDRDDRDGECARRAGMPYVILGQDKQLSAIAKNLLNQFLSI
ncbi:HAD family hydrolase [Microcoleus sp. FACHB-1515]|uniref:HAD family hydrolase n=1 Tax=Cyanophyceae TaxID=3028117 RepID=UPI00168680F6|nr:HAD family hydrolase [Microcoleus sp. FACHB-1515]MBD2091232.1 HAD family hydrolase [Microcoleus sp. FACHB-1515]